jgi:hypothetical protein
MRILVTGDRFWGCHELAAAILRRLVARYGKDIVIVHGGAPGVDESFATASRGLGIAVEPHRADWKGLEPADRGFSPLACAAGRSQTLCRTSLTHDPDFRQTYAVVMAWRASSRANLLDFDRAQI